MEHEIKYLRDIVKPIQDSHWRYKLQPSNQANVGSDIRGRFQLDDLPSGGMVNGRLHLYYRSSLRLGVTDDWSVGLIYTDTDNNSYRVIRCNGPHRSIHTNVIEGNHIPAGTAHIHRLTERYQQLRRPRPDGYAEATNAYTTVNGAIDELIRIVNLQPPLTLGI